MGFFDEQSGGLVTHWKSVAAITSLVGAGDNARIYAHAARQTQAKPFITYNRADGIPYFYLGGPSGARLTVLHVYCWAQTLAGADALAEVVKNNTRNMRGTYTGIVVNRVEMQTIDDGFQYREAASTEMDFFVRLIVRIVHSED